MQFAKKWSSVFLLLLTVGGSLVAGRPALAAERTLGGIKIFGPALAIVRKYGTPNDVRKGDINTAPPPGTLAGVAGANFPSTAGSAPAPVTPDPNASQNGGAVTPTAPGLITWVYYLANGNMMEFVITEADARVVRIHLTGYKSAIRTAKGISLGQTYKQVLDKYGFPEDHDEGTASMLSSTANNAIPGQATAPVQTGPGMGTGTTGTTSTANALIVEARYTERDHITFQFYNGHVVGILVGIVD